MGHEAATRREVRWCTGADLGPQLFAGERPEPDRVQPLHMRQCRWSPDRQTQYLARGRCKPGGGIWTSTALSTDPPWSDWLRWARDEEWYHPPRYQASPALWLLYPDPGARLLVVDTLDDLEAAVARYPHARVDADGHEWGEPEEVDHPAARDDGYDGFCLTEDGQWATRLTMPLDLYGWDAQSTIWYRWAFSGEPAPLGDVAGAMRRARRRHSRATR